MDSELLDRLPETLKFWVLAVETALSGHSFNVEVGTMTVEGSPEENYPGFSITQHGLNVVKYGFATRVTVAIIRNAVIIQVHFPDGKVPDIYRRLLAHTTEGHVVSIVRRMMIPYTQAS